MSNKTYDVLKNAALFGAPIIVFISALCSIWDVPYCAQITASLAALDTLLGAIVVVAKKIYDSNSSKN